MTVETAGTLRNEPKKYAIGNVDAGWIFQITRTTCRRRTASLTARTSGYSDTRPTHADGVCAGASPPGLHTIPPQVTDPVTVGRLPHASASQTPPTWQQPPAVRQTRSVAGHPTDDHPAVEHAAYTHRPRVVFTMVRTCWPPCSPPLRRPHGHDEHHGANRPSNVLTANNGTGPHVLIQSARGHGVAPARQRLSYPVARLRVLVFVRETVACQGGRPDVQLR